MLKKTNRFSNFAFGKRFRELLKDTDEQDLANKLDIIATSTFRQWTNGYSLPTCENLYKISKYFNVTSDYLLGLSESKTYGLESLREASGLSDGACDNLENWKQTDAPRSIFRALSFIIEHGYEFLEVLNRFLFVKYYFADIKDALPFELPKDSSIYSRFPLITTSPDTIERRLLIETSRLNDMHFGEIIRFINRFKEIADVKSK